jgi:hypothetical protein
MADVTVTSAIDAFMEAANQASMLAALNITLGGAFATSGAFSTTLTVTGNTNVTLPTSGTLAILGGNTFTGANNTTLSALAGTTTTGYSLINSTAATSGVQQVSPSFLWRGFGWKTNDTAASRSVEFQAFVLPVLGTANPTGFFKIQKSINSETMVDVFTLLATSGTGDTTMAIGSGTAALSIINTSGFYTTFSIGSGGLRYSLGGTIAQYVDYNRVTLGSGIALGWSSTTAGTGTADSGLGRSAAGVVEVNSGTLGTLRDILTRNTITTPVTVAGLAGATKGARAFVTDATATLTAGIGTTVTGGGANNVPVVYDGTNWLIG